MGGFNTYFDKKNVSDKKKDMTSFFAGGRA